MASSKTNKKDNDSVSWQAQKSAMTRERILDAAIDCFINLGYTNVTAAKVADFAGVSRGAMLHHFPSKTELIQASVEYLHDKLVQDYTTRVNKIPDTLSDKERRRAGIYAYWDHLSGDLFTAHHELCVAGRTDPELQDILRKTLVDFEEKAMQTNSALFKEWNDGGDSYLFASDLTKFLLKGMSVDHIGRDRDKRIHRLLDYLVDQLEEILEKGSSTTASPPSSK